MYVHPHIQTEGAERWLRFRAARPVRGGRGQNYNYHLPNCRQERGVGGLVEDEKMSWQRLLKDEDDFNIYCLLFRISASNSDPLTTDTVIPPKTLFPDVMWNKCQFECWTSLQSYCLMDEVLVEGGKIRMGCFLIAMNPHPESLATW